MATSRYLHLPNLSDTKHSYLVSMPPTNSSGDTYHILAYLILAESADKQKPKILLTYDSAEEITSIEGKTNTYTQVNRSIDFANWLGQGDAFMPPKFINTGNCQREKNRQNKWLSYLETLGPTIHYLNQKALTTLIAYHFMQNGFEATTTALRHGFTKTDDQHIHAAEKKLIANKTKNEMKKINEFTKGNPFIIFHIRNSSKANKNQNLNDTRLKETANFVSHSQYKIWYIFTDSRQKGSFGTIQDNQRTDVFPYNLTHKESNKVIDCGKLYHTQLLHDLQPLANLKGVFGNTSGTLDLAAFLGHRVYNVHHFENIIDTQAYRIIIQSAFMSVDFFNENEFDKAFEKRDRQNPAATRDIVSTHLPQLGRWLESNNPNERFAPVKTKHFDSLNPCAAAYKELFFYKNKKSVNTLTKRIDCAIEVGKTIRA